MSAGGERVLTEMWNSAEDEVEKLRAEIERLRAVLRDIVAWDERNGGYAELPPLMVEAKSALADSH